MEDGEEEEEGQLMDSPIKQPNVPLGFGYARQLGRGCS